MRRRVDIQPTVTLPAICQFDLDPPDVLSDGAMPCMSEHHVEVDFISTTSECPNLNVNTDENCEIYIPYNMADVIKSSYMNNTFWSTFSFMKSLANGHCIMNSIALCLNRLHSIDYRIDLLLDSLIEECNNFDKYKHYYFENEQAFYSEMRAYVYSKHYESLFCEFVPAIMANALKHIIVVIDIDAYAPDKPVNVYDYVPKEYVDRNPICTKCGQKLGILVLLRRSDHYNACVQNSKYSSPCSCNISPHVLVGNALSQDNPGYG